MSFKRFRLGILKAGARDHETRTRYLRYSFALLLGPQLQLQSDAVPILRRNSNQTLQGDHTNQELICPLCTTNLLIEMASNRSVLKSLRFWRKAYVLSRSTLGTDHNVTLECRSVEAMTVPFTSLADIELSPREILGTYTSLLGPCNEELLTAMFQ